MNAQQTAADLLSAANLIEHVGWNQGSASGPNGEVCAYQAISDSTGESYLRFNRAYFAMKEHIGLDRHADPLSEWNDADGRTKEQVTSALRGAAEAVFPDA